MQDISFVELLSISDGARCEISCQGDLGAAMIVLSVSLGLPTVPVCLLARNAIADARHTLDSESKYLPKIANFLQERSSCADVIGG
jgi:hypothetical protein